MLILPSRYQPIAALQPAASAPAGVTWTFTDTPANQNIGFGSVTATFTGVAFGTATSDRIAVVGIGFDQDLDVGGVVIGGVTATQANAADRGCAIYYAALPSGTTGDVVVTTALGPWNKIGICAGAFTGATATPTSTDATAYGFNADPHAVSLTVPSNGLGLAAAWFDNATGTPSWANATADAANQSQSISVLLAHTTTSGAQSPQVSGFNFIGGVIVGAAWGP